MSLEVERRSRGDRKAAEELERRETKGATLFKAIKAPVGIRRGKQVKNHVGDQQAVMDRMDKLSTEFGGNRRPDGTLELWWPLAIEGNCNQTLYGMILRVQNAFQKLGQLGFAPDGVIDPGGRTDQLMRMYSGDILPFPATQPIQLAIAAIPLALQWAGGAISYLQQYQQWRQAKKAGAFKSAAADIHLHLNLLSDTDSLPRIDEWIQNYRMIDAALRNSSKVFVNASRELALAERNTMNCWGITIPAWARPNQNIWFGPDMIGLGIKCRAAILLHEGGHYIRAKIGHQGGERGAAYDSQSADQALTSAYVCANFATHATTGVDERFGLARARE